MESFSGICLDRGMRFRRMSLIERHLQTVTSYASFISGRKILRTNCGNLTFSC